MEPGARYYYRAFAINQVGETKGIRKLKNSRPAPAYCLVGKDAGCWKWLDRVRLVWSLSKFEETEWIFHTQLGWIYAPAESTDGIWLWMEQEGWLWTNRPVWPYLWKHDSGSWLYFQGNQESGQPIFFDYSIEQWR